MKFNYVFFLGFMLDSLNLVNPGDSFIIELVSKAFHDTYYSCRDPEDLLERPDLMENKGLRYFFI